MRQLMVGLGLAAISFGLGCSPPTAPKSAADKADTGKSATARRDGGPAVSRLNGGGSSFINPMMSKWSAVYAKEKGVEVDYVSVGSGSGVQQMTAKTIDFGCTDAPMSAEQLETAGQGGGEVIHVPLVMGGVVPAYNLPGITETLRFTGPVLADIFMGKIKKWNDPALKDLNPNVALPDQEIATVHRSEASGTTFILTDYLCKVSPEWKSQYKSGTSVKWPVGIGQKGTEGVAGQVSRSPGSIGYVELIYALQNKIQFGSVKNAEGEFVTANLDSVTAAARGALKDIPDDLRYSLTNAPGKDAYPIAGTTWAVLYVKQPPGKAEALSSFLHWLVHEGQANAKDLQYSRVPDELIARIDQKLAKIVPSP